MVAIPAGVNGLLHSILYTRTTCNRCGGAGKSGFTASATLVYEAAAAARAPRSTTTSR